MLTCMCNHVHGDTCTCQRSWPLDVHTSSWIQVRGCTAPHVCSLSYFPTGNSGRRGSTQTWGSQSSVGSLTFLFLTCFKVLFRVSSEAEGAGSPESGKTGDLENSCHF